MGSGPSTKKTSADTGLSAANKCGIEPHSGESKEAVEGGTTPVSNNFMLVADEQREGVLHFKKPVAFDKEKTSIRVHTQNEVQTVTPKELQQFLNGNKKIEKIVVEEVKFDDIKRFQLQFQKEITPLNSRVESYNQKIEQTQKVQQSLELMHVLRLKDLEQRVNKLKSNDPTENIQASEVEQHRATSNSMSLIESNKEKVEQTIVNPVTYIEKRREGDILYRGKIKEDTEYEARAKNSGLLASDNADQDGTKVPVTEKLFKARHRQYQNVKKQERNSITDLYYRVKEHNELFKLGTAFYRDMESGLKSFAFTNINTVEEQQKTILGIASYFTYHIKSNITIITTDFNSSYYAKTDKNFSVKEMNLGEYAVSCFACSDLTIINFSELAKVREIFNEPDIEPIISSVVDSAEIIIWDLPQVGEMAQRSEIFFPISRTIDNTSIVVAPNRSKMKDIVRARNHFDKYEIKIKGLILAYNTFQPGE